MSDFYLNTGNTKTDTCHRCGILITLSEQRGAATGQVHWHKEKHNAPCGLQCFGGGVMGKDYRLGHFHNGPEECPTCKPGTLGREIKPRDS